MKVLIADDKAEVRSALSLLIEQEEGLTVAAVAADTLSLISKIQTMQPDVILLDWELPGLETLKAAGIDIRQALESHREGLIIVALSGRPDARQAAMAAGVDLFVSKGDAPVRLLDALHTTIDDSTEGGES